MSAGSQADRSFVFPQKASVPFKVLTFCARLYDTAGHFLKFQGKIDGPQTPEGSQGGQGDQGGQGGQGGQGDQGGQGGGSTPGPGTGSTP
ncbi:hypothetical protein ACFXJ5_31730 [Streptomyces sp. NPDC059373]